ncbi:10796_t:CDS:1, partial [Gigaspora rosea]
SLWAHGIPYSKNCCNDLKTLIIIGAKKVKRDNARNIRGFSFELLPLENKN